MNTHTHTNGPWYAVQLGASPDHAWAIDSELVEIARLSEWPEHQAESEANARLIATAPELLEVARWVAESLPEIIRTHCPLGVPLSVSLAHDMARAAVSKAKGGEHE